MSFNGSFHLAKPSGGLPLPLWAVFDKVWTSLVGYHAHEFKFVQGYTRLSTTPVVVATIITYVVVIFGGREVMRKHEPFKLNLITKIHNLFLTMLSASLLILFIEQLIPTIWRHGIYENICGADGWTDPLVTLYYLNYVTKYIELLDTFFLMIKKKPLIFLHTYHHPATVLLCYTQLVGATPISWVPITLNLSVHVIMYWYYFQTARGIKVWWKEWITRLQIAQFVIDLGFIYFAVWDRVADQYYPWLPHMGSCAGGKVAGLCGLFILSSYLVLFIMFYIKTYNKKIGRSKMARAYHADKKSNGTVPGSVKKSIADVAKSTCRSNGEMRQLS